MAYRTLIDTATLAKNLGDADWRIFDVRHDLMNPGAGRAQYDEGHLSGATFVDLDADLSGEKLGTNCRHPLPDGDDVQRRLGDGGSARPGRPKEPRRGGGGQLDLRVRLAGVSLEPGPWLYADLDGVIGSAQKIHG